MLSRVIVAVLVTTVSWMPQITQAFLGIPSFLEFGDCAKATLMKNFDPMKYSGLWFDIETVPNEYQHTKKCVTQNYTWTGKQMNVATKGLTDDDEKVRQSALMLQDVKIANPASMFVRATGAPDPPYQIIATDYRTFSCVYSCLDGYAGFMAEFMWVFSRTSTLPAAKVKHCYDIFISMDVNPEKMVPVIQGPSCPYFENLDEMMAESKQHLMKVLGPTESSPSLPVPPAAPSSTVSPAVDANDVHQILDDMQQQQDVMDGLEPNVINHDLSSRSDVTRTNDSPGERKGAVFLPGGSSVREVEAAHPNISSTCVPAVLLLLLLHIFLFWI